MRKYSQLTPEWKNKVIIKAIEYLTGHTALKWHTEANRYAYKTEKDLGSCFGAIGTGVSQNGWRVIKKENIDFVVEKHIGAILTNLNYNF